MARVVKPRKQRTAPSTPLQAMLEEYIESLAVKGFTDDTRHVRREHLSLFERWAMERGLTEPVEVTRPVLERYQRYLYPLPQEGRSALELRQPALAAVALADVVPLDDAAELSLA
jgi:integrase/recombinase XerD